MTLHLPLHLVLIVTAITRTKFGFITFMSCAEGQAYGQDEFFTVMPVSFGATTIYVFVTAHRCEKVMQD